MTEYLLKVKIGRDTEIESKEQAIFLVPSVACANNKHRTRKHESNFKQFLAESKETDFTNIVFCLPRIQKTTRQKKNLLQQLTLDEVFKCQQKRKE